MVSVDVKHHVYFLSLLPGCYCFPAPQRISGKVGAETLHYATVAVASLLVATGSDYGVEEGCDCWDEALSCVIVGTRL